MSCVIVKYGAKCEKKSLVYINHLHIMDTDICKALLLIGFATHLSHHSGLDHTTELEKLPRHTGNYCIKGTIT